MANEGQMNAKTLIYEISEKFPDALRSEIAEAFGIESITVSAIILAGGGERREKKGYRKRCPGLIEEIKYYADKRCGGRVEIIALTREEPALCVNGNYFA